MRTMHWLGCALLVATLPAAGVAAPVKSSPPAASSAGICQVLSNYIEGDVMDLSSVKTDEGLEDSAPRAAVEMAKISADQLEIQNNIALMNAHHCAPFDKPIGNDYMIASMKCKTDMLKGVTSGQSALPESCDHKNWTRDFEVVPKTATGTGSK